MSDIINVIITVIVFGAMIVFLFLGMKKFLYWIFHHRCFKLWLRMKRSRQDASWTVEYRHLPLYRNAFLSHKLTGEICFVRYAKINDSSFRFYHLIDVATGKPKKLLASDFDKGLWLFRIQDQYRFFTEADEDPDETAAPELSLEKSNALSGSVKNKFFK